MLASVATPPYMLELKLNQPTNIHYADSRLDSGLRLGRKVILCCDLSSSFIAVYDDSYCLQLLHPVSLSLLQKLPTEFARKTHLSLISVSPDEQLILCATVVGDVTVIKASSGEVLCRACEHSGHKIGCAVWQGPVEEKDKGSTHVYVGDTSGVVTLINVPKSKVSALFKTVCTRLLMLDSSIIQLDFLDRQLLVCTLTASFICDTRREVFTKVGEKSQAGKFGGCLLKVWPSATDSASPSLQPSRTAVLQSPSSRCNSNCSIFIENLCSDNLDALIQFEEDYARMFSAYYFDVKSLSSDIIPKTDVTSVNTERKYSSPTHLPTNGVWTAHSRKKLCPEVLCFSGRPKARIWESDDSGHVLRTHTLSDVLSVPPLAVYDAETDGLIELSSSKTSYPFTQDGEVPNGSIKVEEEVYNVDKFPLRIHSGEEFNSSTSFQSSSTISFSQIISFQNKFLMLVCSSGLYCYDPISCSIIFHLKICVDGNVKASGKNLLISSKGIFTKFTIMSPEVGILALHSLQLLKSCSHLALQHLNLFEHSAVLCRVRNLVIRDILSVLTDANSRQKFEKLLDSVTQKLEPRSFSDLLPHQEQAVKIPSLTAVSVGRSSPEQKSPVKDVSSVDQDCSDVGRELDGSLHLLRPRPVLGVNCSGFVHSSPYRPSGHTVFQDLVESVAFNVSSSSLLTAFSSKVTAAAKRSFDSVTTNFNDVSQHHENSNNSIDNLDSLQNENDGLKYDDGHLLEDELASEDVATQKCKVSMNISETSSRPASDSRNGTPNSCEDSVGVRSDTDDLVVFRSVRRKKKTRNTHRKKIAFQNFSTCSLEDCERPIRTTSLNGVHEKLLLGLMKDLNVKTISCKEEIHNTYNSSALILWLSEFIEFLKAVHSLSSNGRDRTSNDQTTCLPQLRKLTNDHHDLLGNISHLLVYCLNNKLFVSSTPPENTVNANTTVNYHFLTTRHERELDDFYARVFTSAHNFIDKEFIINNSPLPAVFSFMKTWRMLLSSISENCAAVTVVQPPPMIDILPALDFSRHQRLTVLTRSLFQDGVSGLVKAAAKLGHSATVFEMLMVLESRSTESLSCGQASPQDCYDRLDILYLYLTEVCTCSETRAKYVQVWSCSRQMQYDIIHCILKNRKHLLRSCPCGATLPVMLPRDAIFCLLRTAVMGPLYDPSAVYELCRTMGYWLGCASVFLLHELGQVSECMPLVLQSCSAESLSLLFQAIQPSHVPQLLSLLTSLSDGVQPHHLKCYHCRSVNSIYGRSVKPEVNVMAPDVKTSIHAHDVIISYDEVTSTDHDSGNDCVLPLAELWTRCVEAAVGLVGGISVLQLLQDLLSVTNILPGIIPTRVYRMLVVVGTAQPQDTVLLRHSLLRSSRGRTDFPLQVSAPQLSYVLTFSTAGAHFHHCRCSLSPLQVLTFTTAGAHFHPCRCSLPLLQEKRRILRSVREKYSDSSAFSLSTAHTAGPTASTAATTGGSLDADDRTGGSLDADDRTGGSLNADDRTGGSLDADDRTDSSLDTGSARGCTARHEDTVGDQVVPGDGWLTACDHAVAIGTHVDPIATMNDDVPNRDSSTELNYIATSDTHIGAVSSGSVAEQILPDSTTAHRELSSVAHTAHPAGSSADVCDEGQLPRILMHSLTVPVTQSSSLLPSLLLGDRAIDVPCRNDWVQSEPVYGIYLQGEGANCFTCSLPLSLPSLLAPGQSPSASRQNLLHARASLHADIRGVARSRLMHRANHSSIDSLFSTIIRAFKYKPSENISWSCCVERCDHRAANCRRGHIFAEKGVLHGPGLTNSSARVEVGTASTINHFDHRVGQAIDDSQSATHGKNYSLCCPSRSRVTGLLVQWCAHASHAACLHSQDL
ncbi:WD40-repeat-containing domain [Trinorchestia longiramus]|nr:WD40-repeat-containing domain [Trinorchestia longiramus]